MKANINQTMDRAEELLEVSLAVDGFFMFTGADNWQGGIRLTGLTALNWKRISPDKYKIIFYYQGGQVIEVDLGLNNFRRLAGYIA